MLRQIEGPLKEMGVRSTTIRVVDHDVRPGVEHDMGDGDAWPMIEEQLLESQILVLGTPVWLGAPSSVCKRVVERLDAMLGDVDDHGRMPTFGITALVAVVGNEDGAHHCAAECFQWLADTGFTIPASGSVYWVGEAMGSVDFTDLDKVPDKVTSAARVATSNAIHLARALSSSPYPGDSG
jgi:multimeric flavodoxin WrbA